MARNSLYRFSSSENLSRAWEDMFNASRKNKRDGFGFDGISINKFKENESLNIFRLSNLLRKKEYQPQLLIPHFIPKSNGKDRVICVPSVVDRLVQRALLSFLITNGYGFVNSVSYGFVKGRTVSMAAQKAIEYRKSKPWVYKADISAFFDRIDRGILTEYVKKNIRLSALYPIMEEIINTEIYCRHDGVVKRINKMGIKEGIGLRQGMPISPYLANLMLLEFDRSIQKKGISMIRYADDFIVFSDSESECYDIHKYCVEELSRIGLDIHPIGDSDKTVIASPSDTIEFLGLGLSKISDGYTLKVTHNQLESIKNKIFMIGDLDYCMKNGIHISKLTERLDDMVSGYSGAYHVCSNHDQLIDVLNSARNETMTRLFVRNFGIEYKSLSMKHKKFLQIC